MSVYLLKDNFFIFEVAKNPCTLDELILEYLTKTFDYISF